jgi:hypothetical protein
MGVGTWLLGIDWSHISDTAPVKERDGSPVSDGWKVEQNTGLMGVVPAWKIAEILDDDDVIQVREGIIRESMGGT